MRRFLFSVLLFVASAALFAQNDITKFLGIPVDGTKPAMVQQLKAKGFVPSATIKDVLEGEFNGMNVQLYICTTNNKVSRIMVSDANTTNEADIKIRFNNLCQQFKKNKKYVSLEDYTIPDDEDISYEMTVNKKRYQAIFYQTVQEVDTAALINYVSETVLSKYTEEELKNPTEDMEEECQTAWINYAMDMIQKKPVWFTIFEYYGKYRINIYYDNEYNRASGEDL